MNFETKLKSIDLNLNLNFLPNIKRHKNTTTSTKKKEKF